MLTQNLKLKLKLKLFFLTIIFCGVFGVVEKTWAANYYVRIDGNNNCNGLEDIGGSSGSCAFRTVQKGIDTALLPGDVVNIRGDHTDEGLLVTKAGGCSGASCETSPTYITIQITPGTTEYSAIISPGIQINHSYIIVQDLGITGSSIWGSGLCGVTLGFSGLANNNIIRKNHIYNPVSPTASCAISFGANSRYNIAENNLIEGDTNPVMFGGHHTGVSGERLDDSYQTWTVNQWQGRRIHKFTGPPWDGTDAGMVISNDANSITTSEGIVWNNNDCYGIGSSFKIPVIISGTDNIFRNNIIRNLINTERVFDGLNDNTVLEGNEVSNMLDSNEYFMVNGLYGVDDDNCGAHTDLFQVVFNQSMNVSIKNNYFHDLQAQTGMIDRRDGPVSDWKIINNIFANITHRNTIGGPGFKFWNNTFFNVAQSEQVHPLEGWSIEQEYRNNIIIGGSTNPDFGIIGGGPQGDWQECAKNVITKAWLLNTNISYWIGQGGTQAMLTANDSVYIGAGSGSTGSSQPNWSVNCPNVGNTCTDNGITWTNIAWNTTCTLSGTKDVLFGNTSGWNKKTNVISSFTCNSSAVPDGDPRIYDAEGTKKCLIKDSSDNPASNNYYSIWNPPTYGARTTTLIDKIGDKNYINGGNPKFVTANTDCTNNVCDFRLQSDSPLIGAGIFLVDVPTDKNGVARPSSPSIGAYEYVESGDTIAPVSPSGLSVM